MKNTLFTFLIFSICLIGNIGLQAQTGCTVTTAHNYDPNAVNDDGSCETCFDGVKNGDEEEVDCGGSNPACKECFRLDVHGNAKVDGSLGVGTDDPKSELHIKGNADMLNLEGTDHAYIQFFPKGFSEGRKSFVGYQNSGSTALSIQSEDANVEINSQTADVRLDAADDIILSPDDDVILSPSGFVGIGTSSPTHPLHVSGAGTVIFSIAGGLADPPGFQAAIEGDAFSSNTCYGVFGSAFSASTSNVGHGVYGTVSGQGTNYAGYFNGRLHHVGAISSGSDRKLKKDIKPLTNSLAKLMKLKPKTYQFDLDKHTTMNLSEGDQFGFIAQEVREVFPELVSEHTHTSHPSVFSEDKSEVETQIRFLGMEYIPLIPILTQAIQEQQELITDQQEDIEELKGLVNRLLQSNTEVSTILTEEVEVANNSSLIFQNQPNPFTTETTINYDLPETTQKATIHITDLHGKILQSYPINNIGKGSLTVKGSTFAAGIYMYSLELDGQLVASKKMVLSK